MKVSIITASFNNERTISDTVDSIITQSYKNIEYIIIDGNSSDKTLDKISKKIAFNPHSFNVVIKSESDQGIYDALNKGIKIATGDIIGFLHADDLFYDETVVEKVVIAFTRGNYDAVYGDLQYVAKGNTENIIRNWISKPFYSPNLKKGWMPPHPTLYLKKEIYEQYGNFDLKYYIAADYDFMLRILSKDIKAHYISAYFVKMRVGGKSNKLINLINKMKEDVNALKKNGVGGYYSLFLKNICKVTQFFNR